MARDVELNITANDKTFAGTTSARRNLDKVDDGLKKVSKSGDDTDRSMQRMSKSVERSSSMMTTLGAKLLGGGGAVLGMIALREAAMGLSGGIVFGLGAALVAVAIKAQSMTKGVQTAFADLKAHVVDSSVTMSSAFGPALVRIAGIARNTFDNLVPDLTIAFRKMAPAVQRFAGDFGKALGNLRPAIQPLADGFVKLLAATGPALQGALTSVASGLKSIGDEVNRNPQEFAQFVSDMGNLTEFALKGAAATNNFANAFTQNLKMVFAELQIGYGELTGNTNLQNEAQKRGEQAFRDLNHAITPAAQSMATLSDGEQVLAEQAKAAADALKKQNQATLAASDASIALEQAIDDAAKAVKGGSHALDINTQKGRDNTRALNGIASAAFSAADAARAHGDGEAAASGKIARGRKAYVDLATQLTGNAKKANQMADAIGLIPTSHKTKVTADTSQGTAAAESFQRRIDNLHGKTVSVTVVTRGSTGTLGKKIMAKGGIIDEPVMGVGVRTGREYLMGEAGPEAVVPLSGGQGAMPAPGGGVGLGGVVMQFIAPNYIGPLDTLKRSLSDLARTGQLAATLRAAGVNV